MHGSSGDPDVEKRLMDMGQKKERVGQMERVAWKHIHHHMQNRQPVGIFCMTQGTQIRALTPSRGGVGREVGGDFKREGTYVYYG